MVNCVKGIARRTTRMSLKELQARVKPFTVSDLTAVYSSEQHNLYEEENIIHEIILQNQVLPRLIDPIKRRESNQDISCRVDCLNAFKEASKQDLIPRLAFLRRNYENFAKYIQERLPSLFHEYTVIAELQYTIDEIWNDKSPAELETLKQYFVQIVMTCKGS